MKQTLHIGDKVKVINCKRMTFHTGEITDFILGQNNNVKVKINNYSGYFYFNESELQLIKPKTKKVKCYLTKKQINILIDAIDCYTDEYHDIPEKITNKLQWYLEDLLATQPQPIKEDKRDCFNCWHADECAFCEDGSDYCPLEKRLNKPKQEESKDIEFEEIKKIKNQDSNGYLTDVYNQIITIKINEIIDTLNSLTKRNIK